MGRCLQYPNFQAARRHRIQDLHRSRRVDGLPKTAPASNRWPTLSLPPAQLRQPRGEFSRTFSAFAFDGRDPGLFRRGTGQPLPQAQHFQVVPNRRKFSPAG